MEQKLLIVRMRERKGGKGRRTPQVPCLLLWGFIRMLIEPFPRMRLESAVGSVRLATTDGAPSRLCKGTAQDYGYNYRKKAHKIGEAVALCGEMDPVPWSSLILL